MNLTVAFTAFGLVGAVIGLFISVPLKRWWHNRRYQGCVEILGVNTATGVFERHLVKPEDQTVSFRLDAGLACTVPINYGAGFQSGNRRAYVVDLATQTQLHIPQDDEPKRLTGAFVRDVLKGQLLRQIAAIQDGRSLNTDRRLMIGLLLLAGVVILGFGILWFAVSGIETAPHTVGNVVRP